MLSGFLNNFYHYGIYRTDLTNRYIWHFCTLSECISGGCPTSLEQATIAIFSLLNLILGVVCRGFCRGSPWTGPQVVHGPGPQWGPWTGGQCFRVTPYNVCLCRFNITFWGSTNSNYFWFLFTLHPLSVLHAQATSSFIFRHAIFRHAI